MKKVLLINSVCGIGSTGRICTDIADELTKRGHEVKIAYGRGNVPDNSKEYAIRIGSPLSPHFHAILSRVTDSSGFHSTWETKKFIKWIKQYDPDIIHIHNIHGYYINIEVLFDYLRVSNKKIIWTLHDCWPFTGHSALCDAIDCEKWKSGCGACPQIRSYPKSFIDRSQHNWKKKKECLSDVPNMTIVVPSKWLERNVAASFLSQYRTLVINNGIDLDYFRRSDGGSFRKKNNLEDKTVVLGVASKWTKAKGYYDYFKLSEMLDERYVVVLVGEQKDKNERKSSRLLMIGKTNSHQDLIDIYSASDIFVNLTYCDTYPTVNLEASACGLPVITYNTGGSPEAAGEGAVIVEKGDLHSVYQCIVSKKYGRSSIKDGVSAKENSMEDYICLLETI